MGIYLHTAGARLTPSAATDRLLQEAMVSAAKRRKRAYRRILKEAVTDYLSHVNANLVLANEFGCGVHDWGDFEPFYRQKFLRVGQALMPHEKDVRAVRRLFGLCFPAFASWEPRTFVKALKDKRVAELRGLVSRAAAGEVALMPILRTAYSLTCSRSNDAWRLSGTSFHTPRFRSASYQA
jgi:hypothetical protein